MKKLIILSLIFTISCGKNAFLNSTKKSLINTVTTQDPSDSSGSQDNSDSNTDINNDGSNGDSNQSLNVKSYIGTNAMSLLGFELTNFESEINTNSGTKSLENFSQSPLGAKCELSSTIDGIKYKIQHLEDNGELGTTPRTFVVEKKVTQDKTKGDGVGLDFHAGSPKTRNSMLITFDQPIAHFGIDLIDFESDINFTVGKLRAYNCSSEKIFEMNIDFLTENGNRENHFIGFTANKAQFCKVIVIVGDDGLGDGNKESFAIDNLRFGTATN